MRLALLNSIFFKLSILFLFSLSVMYLLADRNEKIIDTNLKNYAIPHLYSAAKEIIQKLAIGDDIETILQKYELTHLKKRVPILHKEQSIESELYKISILHDEQGFYYLEINYLDEPFLFFDQKQSLLFEKSREFQWLIYLDVLLLFLIFTILIYLISPLKNAVKTLKTFGEGNLKVRVEKSGSEEFKVFKEEFNKMAENLENLIAEKDNFISFASHELKTPIAKAKIALSLLPQDRHKGMLAKTIEQMDEITESFLTLESLKNGIQLNMQKTKMSEIVFEIHSMLCDETEFIGLEMVEDFILICDKKRLAIALKNIIENGIKYSRDKHVEVVITQKKIIISNRGAPLQELFENLTTKFTRGRSNEEIRGYGVGLSIAKAIFEAHSFEFGYSYEADLHYFCISLCKL